MFLNGQKILRTTRALTITQRNLRIGQGGGRADGRRGASGQPEPAFYFYLQLAEVAGRSGLNIPISI